MPSALRPRPNHREKPTCTAIVSQVKTMVALKVRKGPQLAINVAYRGLAACLSPSRKVRALLKDWGRQRRISRDAGEYKNPVGRQAHVATACGHKIEKQELLWQRLASPLPSIQLAPDWRSE